MYIPARERAVLLYLLESDHYTTIKDIASALEVSERTIHRDLKGIDEVLTHYQLILESKKGQGIQLIGSQTQKNKMQENLSQTQPIEYTKDERITIILTTLFSTSEPTKLIALANDLNVTIATISHDLDHVELVLKDFNLKLIRKRGYGVVIAGKEENKRAALKSLIAQYIDPFEVVHLFKTQKDKEKMTTDYIAGRLLDFVDHETIVEIEANVEEVFKVSDIILADNAYIGLVVHLALAIQRLKSGEKIHFDAQYLEEIQSYGEFKVAKLLTERLEIGLQLEIPLDEIGYITMHLLGAKQRESEALAIAEDSAMDIAVDVRKLMQYVSQKYDSDIENSPRLLTDLVTHLKPALFRIKRNMKIVNPLLDDVEKNYSKLMQVVAEGVQRVFPKLNFPADEIGYLVMHFGAQLYRKIKAKEIKALVICSSGIGTARILATRLQQNFPEIKTIKTISMLALKETAIDQYDIILSTIKLHRFDYQYIIVSPMLLEDELIEIQKYLAQIAPLKEKSLQVLPDSTDYNQQLAYLSQQSVIAQALIEQIEVNDSKTNMVDQIIIDQSDLLAQNHIVTNAEKLAADLSARYQLGGLAIPELSLALFHTRSDVVKSPHFSIVNLEEAVEMAGMDGQMQKVKTVAFMLASEQAEEAVLTLLSYLSTLLIQDEKFVDLLHQGNEEAIKNYLAEVFYKYLMKK